MSSSNERVTKATFWQQHIQQWKTAQQTQIAYCRAHSLNVPQFNYWVRKERSANAQKNKKATFPSPFIPVVKHQSAPSGLSLSLPNGMMLQGIDLGNLSSVKQLLELLS
jgi:hypothetical protein